MRGKLDLRLARRVFLDGSLRRQSETVGRLTVFGRRGRCVQRESLFQIDNIAHPRVSLGAGLAGIAERTRQSVSSGSAFGGLPICDAITIGRLLLCGSRKPVAAGQM